MGGMSGSGFLIQRKNVGGYRMGDITFMLTRRPSGVHRFFVWLVLGWVWVDARK